MLVLEIFLKHEVLKLIQVYFSKLVSAVRLGVLSGVLWGAKNGIELGTCA